MSNFSMQNADYTLLCKKRRKFSLRQHKQVQGVKSIKSEKYK